MRALQELLYFLFVRSLSSPSSPGALYDPTMTQSPAVLIRLNRILREHKGNAFASTVHKDVLWALGMSQAIYPRAGLFHRKPLFSRAGLRHSESATHHASSHLSASDVGGLMLRITSHVWVFVIQGSASSSDLERHPCFLMRVAFLLICGAIPKLHRFLWVKWKAIRRW